jgi:hypothetical protein
MIPTVNLRWVPDLSTEPDPLSMPKILQQWWMDIDSGVYIPDSPSGTAGEWRDVPLVK